MVANVAANMYGCYPNIYNNQIALNDLSGLDAYYPTGMCMDPMLSMNGSIFGGYGGMMPGMMPGMGMMPGIMPGAIPFTGNNGNGQNMTYADYLQEYERCQDIMIDSQVRQQQNLRNAELRLTAPQEGIQARANILNDKIVRNEQNQIKQAYETFLEGVRNMYGDASDENIKNRANALYKQAIGKTIIEDVREHGHGSFTQGFLQSATFGLFNRKTAEETVSELTGQPVGTEENAKKIAGNVVGGAAVGGTVFALSGAVCKGLKIASKSRTFWGIALGALAGIGAAIVGSK